MHLLERNLQAVAAADVELMQLRAREGELTRHDIDHQLTSSNRCRLST